MDRFELSGCDWEMKEFVGEDWVWRDAHRRQTKDIRWWKSGMVPSSVTYDLYQDGEIPDPYYEKNSLLLEWIPERTWVYRKKFRLPEEMMGKRIRLCFGGVDYECLVYVNDVLVAQHKGMFTPFFIDITKNLELNEENLLAVVIQKAPDEQPQVSKTRYVKTHKSRMTYWWDFCPRMIHLGIWKDVWLEADQGLTISSVDVDYTLKSDYQSVEFSIRSILEGEMNLDQITVECTIFQSNKCVVSKSYEVLKSQDCKNVNFVFQVETPELWWPNEYGKQPLYEIKVSLFQTAKNSKERKLLSSKQIRTGVRQVVFEKNEGASADAHAYTLKVNGRQIYMKGWNWVPIDVLYGVKREEKLRYLIQMVRSAHVNILRIWGGGLIEREEFYNLCDEYGIFIWQEFIQSSSGIDNKPSEEPEFLELMENEADSIIREKKNHPSLVIWGGGNELQGAQGTMISLKEPVIRVLQSAVNRWDKNRYFLESSPTGKVFNNTIENIVKFPDGMHDVHGPWEHQGLEEQYTLYNCGTALLSSEFGVEGMANYKTLLRVMHEKHLWPPSRDNAYYFHRGSWWNNFPLIQECFDWNLKEIREVIMASQLLQYEGLKYAVESNRRRAMHSSGTFPWQFNEPYPNNTCTSCVDYYGIPKPAYYGVSMAYRYCIVTAEFPAQTMAGRQEFNADIYLQSSAKHCQANLVVKICDSRGKIIKETYFSGETGKEKAVCLGTIFFNLNEVETDIFFLLLEANLMEQKAPIHNRYLFTKSTLAPILSLPQTSVEVTVCTKDVNKLSCEICVVNTGKTAAVGVKLEDAGEPDEYEYLIFSENYFYLMPGENKKVIVNSTRKRNFTLSCTGSNLEEQQIEVYLLN